LCAGDELVVDRHGARRDSGDDGGSRRLGGEQKGGRSPQSDGARSPAASLPGAWPDSREGFGMAYTLPCTMFHTRSGFITAVR
jgi:hypothetical protein